MFRQPVRPLPAVLYSTGQAVVPQVAITVRNERTNVTNRTESNATGLFVVPALRPGSYELTAEKQGFRAFSFDLGTMGFPASLANAVTYRQFPEILVQQYATGSGLAVATFGANEVGNPRAGQTGSNGCTDDRSRSSGTIRLNEHSAVRNSRLVLSVSRTCVGSVWTGNDLRAPLVSNPLRAGLYALNEPQRT